MSRLGPCGAARPQPGIVHLGLGAFFRAHGALYIDEVADGAWGIVGVSLRSADIRDRLAPQGGCYTAVEMAPDGMIPRHVEIVRKVLVAPQQPQAVLNAMAAETTHIVSLTVTEKGYCHLPASGMLNPDHPDIAHDLGAVLPRSAPGFLVRALALRRAAGLVPFTVLSCDNLPDNGALVRRVVLDLAARIDPTLAAWIEAEGAFPATMVDRIVPATTPQDVDAVAALIGTRDAAPVLHEPFRQWVIEDRFAGPRPDLARAGAQMVQDVTPFEHMKLRMLNGSHSALAYLGQLLGHRYISDTMQDSQLRAFVEAMMHDEIAPTLVTPPGTDLAAYAASLLKRFENPAMFHETRQIAMDGSQKLPQRLLETIQDGLDAGRDVSRLCASVAAWIAYVEQTAELNDPMAERLKQAVAADDPVIGVLALREVFPEPLADAIAPIVSTLFAACKVDGPRALLTLLAGT